MGGDGLGNWICVSFGVAKGFDLLEKLLKFLFTREFDGRFAVGWLRTELYVKRL